MFHRLEITVPTTAVDMLSSFMGGHQGSGHSGYNPGHGHGGHGYGQPPPQIHYVKEHKKDKKDKDKKHKKHKFKHGGSGGSGLGLGDYSAPHSEPNRVLTQL